MTESFQAMLSTRLLIGESMSIGLDSWGFGVDLGEATAGLEKGMKFWSTSRSPGNAANGSGLDRLTPRGPVASIFPSRHADVRKAPGGSWIATLTWQEQVCQNSLSEHSLASRRLSTFLARRQRRMTKPEE